MLSDLAATWLYAFRMLARAPGFTARHRHDARVRHRCQRRDLQRGRRDLCSVAPVADPDRVVSLYSSRSDGRAQFSSSSYPDYVDLRDSGALDALAAFASITLSFESGGSVEQITGEVVSGNYFDVLGVPISIGRSFHADEDRIGSPVRAAVVSYAFWQQLLGSFICDREAHTAERAICSCWLA